jgi:hypothetical protein
MHFYCQLTDGDEFLSSKAVDVAMVILSKGLVNPPVEAPPWRLHRPLRMLTYD